MRSTDFVGTLINGWALLAAAIIAVATRYGNAFLTKPDAPDWITGPVAAVLAGLGAIAAYLVDVKGVGTWQGALTIFVTALTATKFVQAEDPGLEPILKQTKGGLSPARAPSPGQGEPSGMPTTPTDLPPPAKIA